MANNFDIKQLAELYKKAEATKQEHLKAVIGNAVGEAAGGEAALAEAADLQVRLQEPPIKSNLAAEAELHIAVAEQLSSAEAAEAAVRIMQNFAAETLSAATDSKKQ